jgi:(p)ppGpp synthase/HD superfamily hydrolase
VLNNGDVVSILTGEGTPTTEWMKFAKSRSTRSKLRAHFRAKQHDSITKTGESMFFDYLKNHRDEIRRSSYLGYEFDIPLDKSELSRFLPGRSHYTDVDELLFAIGELIPDRSWCRLTAMTTMLLFCVRYRNPPRRLRVAGGGVWLFAFV